MNFDVVRLQCIDPFLFEHQELKRMAYLKVEAKTLLNEILHATLGENLNPLLHSFHSYNLQRGSEVFFCNESKLMLDL